MLVPAFDVVRVEPEGSALIAGQAEPQSEVFILVDAVEAATAESDDSGRFVALFTLAPSDQARMVTLLSRMPDGREKASAASVVLAPTPKPDLAVADAGSPAEAPAAGAEPAPETNPETIPEAVPEAATTASETAAADPAAGSDAPVPVASAVLLADETGVKVLQPAGDVLPETVVIDTIAYDADGQVTLGGRGQGGAALQVYLDNAASIATRIAPDGSWTTPLPGVRPGIYTLRVDQLDETGKVTSRYETPFKREDPAALASLNALAEAPKAAPAAEAVTDPATTATIAAVEPAKPEPATQPALVPAAEPPPAAVAQAEPEPALAEPAPAEVEQAKAEPAEATPAEVVAVEPAPEPAIVPEPAPAVEVVVAAPAPAPATEAAAPSVAAIAAAPAPEVAADAATAPVEPAATQLSEPATNSEPAAEPDASTDVASAAPAPLSEAAPQTALAEPAPSLDLAEPTAAIDVAPDPEPADVTEGTRVRIVTVQPGFTLWQIANEAYGEGVMYVQVWDANRKKIKNPDLIYPGQVFTVPEPAN